MPADVRSIAAVVDWRADLVTYGELLAESMAGVDMEIRRAQDWLEEQLARWKKAVRDCEEDVTRAKAELSQRQFPTWDGRVPDCTVQEKNLRLARARLEHAEQKVETVRLWIGRLPKMIDEMFTGPSRRLKSMLEADLPNGITALSLRIASLESYAGLRPDYAPGPSTSQPIGPTPQSTEPTPPTPLPAGKGEKEAGGENSDANSSMSSSPSLQGGGRGVSPKPDASAES